jgi:hypothetical protein
MKTRLWIALGALTLTARADVPSVRREVAQIDRALPSLARQTSDRTDLSTEGARITIYGAKKSPRKIRAEIFGESGRKTETIYLSAGTPLFRFSVEERYLVPLPQKPIGKVVSRVETRFYFQNGRLFEMRVGATKSRLSAASKARIEAQTREDVRQYLSQEAGEDGAGGAAR